jgi:hypothetical protein
LLGAAADGVSIRFWLAVIAGSGISLSPRTEQTVLWSNKFFTGTMIRESNSIYLSSSPSCE